MDIQDLKNLDLYKCSLQDINKAFKVLGNYLLKIGCYSKNFKEYKKLHVLISRARLGMNSKGIMLGYNTNIDRVHNSKSVL